MITQTHDLLFCVLLRNYCNQSSRGSRYPLCLTCGCFHPDRPTVFDSRSIITPRNRSRTPIVVVVSCAAVAAARAQ